MDSQLRSQVVFHLTGHRTSSGDDIVAGLRPALFAGYREIDALRHDFPVVFAGEGEDWVQPLSAVVDRLLRAIAPAGPTGEGLRRRVLRLEREIRRRVSAGATGTLGVLWDEAAAALAAAGDEALENDLRRARKALDVDGEVAGCDARLPARYMRHAWEVARAERTREARQRIDRLAIRLGDILRADYMRSERALQQPALQASFGGAHHALFDFAAMSRVLARVGPQGGLGERRRARIERVLEVLRAQRFFAPAGAGPVHEFAFDDPSAALAAFRARLPELVELLKAIQVAELEVDGNYLEALHDPVFAAYDEQAVTAQDLRFFPDYLVCLDGQAQGDRTRFAEVLSSGVPVKLVVRVDDLFEEATPGQGQHAFGLRGAQLASAAMSFDDVFVLQTAASNLVQLRSRVRQGLRHAGPALFCLYAGPASGTVPGYLASAAAMHSRAFPAFSYDPSAGEDLSTRFSLENNPQPEQDWPVERLRYADPELQSVSEDLAFTYADFVLCDPRHAMHFAAVPRAAWGEAMVPMREWLGRPASEAAPGVPFVLAVDDADLLCRLVVDERLVRAALRCREAWHRLQEFGGVRDPRTERRLAREREAWEETHRREIEALKATVAAAPIASNAAAPEAPAAGAPVAAASAPAVAVAEAAEPSRNPDEAYIETIRCSTCNECTQLNPRMFAYNDDKQAYIKDVKAGTYAQLVEAAESCQVSVIHPGKPLNPDEPGLAELLERAKPFL